MKSIFDSSFTYRPSFDTNVRETIRRVRREQQAQIRGASRWKLRKTSRQAEIRRTRRATKFLRDAAR